MNVVDTSNNQSKFDENLDSQSKNNKVNVNTEPVLQLGFENYIGALTNNLVTNVVDTSKNDPKYVENLNNQLPKINNDTKNKRVDNNTELVQLGFENDIDL